MRIVSIGELWRVGRVVACVVGVWLGLSGAVAIARGSCVYLGNT